MYFDGKTYDPVLDRKRLSQQIYVVWDVMYGGVWHTLARLAYRTGFPESSISARLRDFRKPRFGGHEVLRERGLGGVWRYKLIPRDNKESG